MELEWRLDHWSFDYAHAHELISWDAMLFIILWRTWVTAQQAFTMSGGYDNFELPMGNQKKYNLKNKVETENETGEQLRSCAGKGIMREPVSARRISVLSLAIRVVHGLSIVALVRRR